MEKERTRSGMCDPEWELDKLQGTTDWEGFERVARGFRKMSQEQREEANARYSRDRNTAWWLYIAVGLAGADLIGGAQIVFDNKSVGGFIMLITLLTYGADNRPYPKG